MLSEEKNVKEEMDAATSIASVSKTTHTTTKVVVALGVEMGFWTILNNVTKALGATTEHAHVQKVLFL